MRRLVVELRGARQAVFSSHEATINRNPDSQGERYGKHQAPPGHPEDTDATEHRLLGVGSDRRCETRRGNSSGGHPFTDRPRRPAFSKRRGIMNAWKRGLLVGGTLIALALAAGVFVGVGEMAVAR